MELDVDELFTPLTGRNRNRLTCSVDIDLILNNVTSYTMLVYDY